MDGNEAPMADSVVEAASPSDAAMPGLRTGSELVRASQPFAQEDRATTWRLLIVSLLVAGLFEAVALFAPFAALKVVGGLFVGLTSVRLFIFYHDYLHDAILRDSFAGRLVMSAVGMLTLNPPSVWKETHDYHHKNNAKMLGGQIGSYPVVTVAMWQAMTPSQRRWYAFARHPGTIAGAYLFIFMIGMCVSPFRRAPREHWQGPAAIVLHFALLAAVAFTLGPVSAFAGVMFPLIITSVAGGYLFYAQHNFPTIQLRDRKSWDYAFAAVRSSSMFDMGPVMHWFTGNIGFHHVHHLNHRIPFYRLPEAMAAIPELQNPGRTSWRPSDVMACLRLKLWDGAANKMVGWEALG
jgi:omega-6 fatty acid desaturase (delta-12 desaturase)